MKKFFLSFRFLGDKKRKCSSDHFLSFFLEKLWGFEGEQVFLLPGAQSCAQQKVLVANELKMLLLS